MRPCCIDRALAWLFASNVLAWVTAREYAVTDCGIDSIVIDWPLDVSFSVKWCKSTESESGKDWLGAS